MTASLVGLADGDKRLEDQFPNNCLQDCRSKVYVWDSFPATRCFNPTMVMTTEDKSEEGEPGWSEVEINISSVTRWAMDQGMGPSTQRALRPRRAKSPPHPETLVGTAPLVALGEGACIFATPSRICTTAVLNARRVRWSTSSPGTDPRHASSRIEHGRAEAAADVP